MKRITLLFVALAALLVVGVAVWMAANDPSAAPPTTAARPAAATPPRASRAARAAAPVPTPTNVPSPAKDVAEAPVAAKPDDVAPRAVLRFRLDGLDPAISAGDSNVVVVRERDDGRAADDAPTCAADGGRGATFDVDVTALVPDNVRATRLGVWLDRAGYLPFVGHASIASVRRGAKQPDVVETVAVALRPAGWAKGVVQDERFARVADAVVGSFVRDGPAWRRVDDVRADAQGEFRIRLIPGDANLVVADAEGLTPASMQVTGVARAETTLTPFTLQPGLAVSGTIRRGDGRAVAGARISATPIWGRTSLALGPHRLAYVGGQAIECPAGAVANDGLFRVSGLVPGDYDMAVFAPGVATDLLAALHRRASPPVEALAFVVDGGAVVVQATCDGRPVPRLRVAFINESAPPDANATAVATDAKGAARILVQPGAQYRVEIDVPAFDRERRAVSAPPPGAETITEIQLRRRLPRPTLRLRLRPEDADGADAVTAADVRLFLDEDPPSNVAESSETLTFSAGAALATAPWAGAYRVVVLPRGNGFRLPAVARVSLRDGEESKAELKFAHGGRLHLVTHDAEGHPLVAGFRAVGDGGEEIASGATNGDDPLLPSGRRQIEITPPGAAPRPVDVLVRADETTLLDLELQPPRKGN